jgi:Spy/CpxP family protein refolding chaperone
MTGGHAAALIAAVVACAAGATAQMGGPGMMGPPPPGGPAFLKYVFSPKLVMENQQELALTAAQTEGIKQAMNQTQQELLDVQWRLDAESEALGKLLATDHVDEAAVLAKLDQVTATEQQVKRINFALLVRIKNLLTPDQQAKLRTLMQRPGAGPGGPPPPPPD